MVLTIAIRPGVEAWLFEVSKTWVAKNFLFVGALFGLMSKSAGIQRNNDSSWPCHSSWKVCSTFHRAAIPVCIGDTKHVQCELIHCLLRKSMCSMAVTCRTGAFYHCVSLPHDLNFVRTVVRCFTLIHRGEIYLDVTETEINICWLRAPRFQLGS